MNDLIKWAFEKWPVAVILLVANGFLYGGLLFGWGPDVIRPVSAQNFSQQLTVARGEVSSSLQSVDGQLKDIKQTQHDDHLSRVEQQLLWWRQQNCKSKGSARNYAWQKMSDLRNNYRDLTSSDWQMPACSDIGE